MVGSELSEQEGSTLDKVWESLGTSSNGTLRGEALHSLRPRILRDGSRLRLASLGHLVRGFEQPIWELAQSFTRPGLSPEELAAEGRLALVEAAERWQSRRHRFSKRAEFASFAFCWIQAAMALCVLRQQSLVRDPDAKLLTQLSLHFQIADPQIAFQLRDLIVRLARETVARAELREDMDEVRRGPLATLPKSPEEQCAVTENLYQMRRAIMRTWASLDGRERFVLRQRYMGTNQSSLEDIAKSMKISTEAVGGIEKQALSKLRRRLGQS